MLDKYLSILEFVYPTSEKCELGRHRGSKSAFPPARTGGSGSQKKRHKFLCHSLCAAALLCLSKIAVVYGPEKTDSARERIWHPVRGCFCETGFIRIHGLPLSLRTESRGFCILPTYLYSHNNRDLQNKDFYAYQDCLVTWWSWETCSLCHLYFFLSIFRMQSLWKSDASSYKIT